MIIDSIIGEDVIVGEGSRIEGGTLIGSKVVLGANARLRGARIGRVKYDSEVEVQSDGVTCKL